MSNASTPGPELKHGRIRRDDDDHATRDARQDFGVLHSELEISDSKFDDPVVLVAELAPIEGLALPELRNELPPQLHAHQVTVEQQSRVPGRTQQAHVGFTRQGGTQAMSCMKEKTVINSSGWARSQTSNFGKAQTPKALQ